MILSNKILVGNKRFRVYYHITELGQKYLISTISETNSNIALLSSTYTKTGYKDVIKYNSKDEILWVYTLSATYNVNSGVSQIVFFHHIQLQSIIMTGNLVMEILTSIQILPMVKDYLKTNFYL